jgi:hypothetical protein
VTTPLQLQSSRTFPVPVDDAYARVLVTPLEDIFSRRYAAISPITAVREQDGAWGTVGQTRRIVLADGSTMHEELTSVEPGRSFGYRIDDVTGALKPLVSSVDGRWSFEDAGTGVRVTWSWTVHPLNAFSALSWPLLRWMWNGYARLAMERIEQVLLERPQRGGVR